jgi:Tol biopolymer transport system component
MPWTISLVSPEERGPIRELKLVDGNSIHPTWSNDSKQILFGTIPTLEQNPYLYIVDVASERVSVLPGSQGLFSPSWSPDGRFIAALRGDSYQLMLLDRATGTWFALTDSKSGYPVWSRDGKSLYSVQRHEGGSRIYSVDPLTRKLRGVMDLGDFPLLDRWMGFHPDGSLLLAKNASIQEIDLLQVEPRLSGVGR